MIRDPQRLLEFLDEAIVLDRAQQGNIQVYDRGEDSLRIAAQRGFDEAFLKHFEVGRRFDSTSGGRAAGSGGFVMISDTLREHGWEAHREVLIASSVRSCKSVAIMGPDHALLGVLNTHSPGVRWDWERDNTRQIISALARLLAPQPA